MFPISGKNARVSRRMFLSTLTASGFAAGALLAAGGCGGGGGSTPSNSSRSTPTPTTKARVQSLQSLAFRALTQAGFQPMSQAYSRNGSGTGAPVPVSSSGAGAGANSGAPSTGASIPMLGAFLKNVASVPAPTRAAAIRYASRDEPTPMPGPIVGPDPAPTFYYDYYLGLWVDVSDSAGTSSYTLYEDEAKTKPAGSIVTTLPADWSVYPQVYASTYSFTAGYLAGSHGSSRNVTNADYSGSASYENTYVDGWKDKGQSSWSGRGDFSWTSRTDSPNGQWTTGRGGFHSDGSGGTHVETSDSYIADFTYNSDGSGHGRITGSDPGLPVTVSWDAYGNTTIQYADGSIDTVNGWGGGIGGGGGGGTPIPVDGGVSGQPQPAATPPMPPVLPK